jgi:hypothetical protein
MQLRTHIFKLIYAQRGDESLLSQLGVGWLRSANKAFWEINFRISGGARREKQLAHAF